MAKYFEVKNQSGSVIIDDSTSFYALDSVKKLSDYTQDENLAITTSKHGVSIRDTGFRHLYGYTIGTPSQDSFVGLYSNNYNSDVCCSLCRDILDTTGTTWILDIYTKQNKESSFIPGSVYVFIFSPFRPVTNNNYGIEIFNANGDKIFQSAKELLSIVGSGRILDVNSGNFNTVFTQHLATNIPIPSGKRYAYCSLSCLSFGYPYEPFGGYLMPFFTRSGVMFKSASAFGYEQANYIYSDLSSLQQCYTYTGRRISCDTAYLLFDVTHIRLP